jgi:SAM-dependent methyltransferase
MAQIATADIDDSRRVYPESANPRIRKFAAPDGGPAIDIPHDADTSYLAHGFFRYIGKYPPQLVAYVLNSYPPNGPILDSMCGGGTTLIEARLRGIDAVGCDVNPVSRIISSAAAAPLPPDHFSVACRRVIKGMNERAESVAPLLRRGRILTNADDAVRFHLDFCREYFDEATLHDIGSYLAIIKEESHQYRDMFLLCLFAILRKISRANIKKMNLEIDDTKRTIVPFVDAITNQLQFINIENAKYSQWSRACSIEVLEADARDTNLPADTFSVVFLHPPYLTNTAFCEFTQLQLAVLGIDHRSIWKRELRCRGSFLHENNGLKKYLLGWNGIINEAIRVLRPGGILVTVVGDGQMDYVRIPIGAITLEFAKDAGLKVVEAFRHVLNNNTGRTQSRKMVGQHVAIFRKSADA